MADTARPLRVFFDGVCPLCRREAAFYSGRVARDRLVFEDIAASDFDARAHGLDPVAVHRRIHAITPDGQVVRGVDALATMWRLTPQTRWLAWLTGVPVARQLMQVGYAIFARFRPYLPGRTCAAGCATKSGGP